jgi:type I restriction enzyme S subunit
MEEWKIYKLEDVCTELSDGLHKAPKFINGGDYIFVNAKNISNGFIVDNDPTKKSTYEEYVKYSSPLNETTVLYSIDGTIGNIALYRGEKCILGKGACYLNANPALLDRMYLYYELQAPRFKSYIDKMSTGSTIKHISLKTMRNYEMKVPSTNTQQQIVSILKSLDDKIHVSRRINDNLEQQAQALFKSWFVDYEPFKDGEFVESELGMIPKGWRVGQLNEIIKEAESGSRPKGGAETDGIPSIGAEKIERFGVYDYSGEKYINNNYYTQMKRGHVKDGDVLLYKDGAYTGKSSMALDGFPYKECAVNEHVFLLRTEASRFQFYLYFLISYPDIKTMIHTLASAKAAQPGLNQKELLGLDIPMPNEDIIKQFNDLISPYMHQIANNAKKFRRLATLRDTLLPKLMSGELKVNEVEI